MKRKNLFVIVLALALIFTLAACDSGNAGQGAADGDPLDGYPAKNLEVIVAYKAGGGTDVGARLLAADAEEAFGKPIIIVNREGSDGELGYYALASAKPDGYTVGFINLPTFVSLTLERDTKYEIGDVRPILNHVYDPGVLVVRSDSDFDTLDDFIEFAKANPKKITVSNNGTGASNHIGAAHFEHEADIEITHVPFGGSTDMLAALRGGHVDATVAKISEVSSLVDAGELKILASFTPEKLENFPDVETMFEYGYEIEFGSARALVAPKDTPDEIVEYLHDTFKAAMESEDHKAKAAEANLPLKYMSPEELADYIQADKEYLEEISDIIDLEQ